MRLSSRLSKSFSTFSKYLHNNARRTLKVRDFRPLLACPNKNLFVSKYVSFHTFGVPTQRRATSTWGTRYNLALFVSKSVSFCGSWRVWISFFLCLRMSHFILLEYLHNFARQALKARDVSWLCTCLNQSLLAYDFFFGVSTYVSFCVYTHPFFLFFSCFLNTCTTTRETPFNCSSVNSLNNLMPRPVCLCVCVRVCVYMCLCVHVCVCVCVLYMCMYAYMSAMSHPVCIYVCVRVRVGICVRARAHIRVHVWFPALRVYVYVCVCMSVRVCLLICVCICVGVYGCIVRTSEGFVLPMCTQTRTKCAQTQIHRCILACRSTHAYVHIYTHWCMCKYMHR